MKSRRKACRSASSSSSSSSTVTYTFRNDASTPPYKEIPVNSSDRPPTPIAVHVHDHCASSAARIQAAYRSYVIRRLVKKLTTVKSEIDRMERLIQSQETVDALRSSEKEKLKINEQLMRLLLELDSVPGFDTAVRELRRRMSHRIVALQEVVDGICRSGERMEWWDGEWRDWDEIIGEMEEQVCREKGGDELATFCAQHLGFRCMQRFLHQP